VNGLLDHLDGEVLAPGDAGYDEHRRPAQLAFHDVRPRLLIRCASVRDVVAAIGYARTTGERVAVRSGGHCFAGRSSTDGIVIDLASLRSIDVHDDGTAIIGAGARLGQVYPALHAAGRTLPAGCGATVGIAGLTLGGGIGLLGRRHGLTCDRLVGAEVVLADGRVLDCDNTRQADLFWALRGAGSGQFGVVTALRFATVPEPLTTRVELHWTSFDLVELVDAWQRFAPDAPDEITLDLTVIAEPHQPVRAAVTGAGLSGEAATTALLHRFLSHAPTPDAPPALRPGLPYHRLKTTFADPRETRGPVRIRSGFFARTLSTGTVRALIDRLTGSSSSTSRRLTFTAMGGAYSRVPTDATAFAHRGERFLLEHVGAADDRWVDESWSDAAADGDGHVYPNFPDPALTDPAVAYHGSNLARLIQIKHAYDPDRFFDFPQAIPAGERMERQS